MQQNELTEKLTSPLVLGGTTFLTMGAIDILANLGPAGLIFGALPATFVAVKYGRGLLTTLSEGVSLPHEEANVKDEPETAYTGKRSIGDRLLGRYPQEAIYVDNVGDEPEELQPPVSQGFDFSAILASFTPSLHRIYLATLPDGTSLYCQAKDLCHVALAGSTGNGKGFIVRLLMSQLCKAGASVLLLNPHYTRYDLESGEDWTPFTPYLVYDPMECRKYEVIEHYLKQVATVLLPKRLDRYAHSQPVGKPYFIVIDELPAIVEHVKSAPGYLAEILREGRKVGIYLITAAQDFLVKTISPQGGGAVRDCYRTAYYVGGDATTGKVLLDLPPNQIPENELGKGEVMVRNITMKRAVRASVPYVDNEAIYRLLGPSTYTPVQSVENDDLFLERLSPRSMPHEVGTQTERAVPVMPLNWHNSEMEDLPMKAPARQMTELDRAVEAWKAGHNSVAKLEKALNVSHHRAYQLSQVMKASHLI